MSGQKRAVMTLPCYIGEILAVICAVRLIGTCAVNLFSMNALLLAANIIALVGCAGAFFSVLKFYNTPDMLLYPAIFMCVFLASDLLRIFAVHWSWLFMILPLAAVIVMRLMEWNVPGIIAGALTFVLNLFIGILYFHQYRLIAAISALSGGGISGMYMLTVLVNNNSLMGIACILFFLEKPRRRQAETDLASHGGSDGGFGGSSDFGGF